MFASEHTAVGKPTSHVLNYGTSDDHAQRCMKIANQILRTTTSESLTQNSNHLQTIMPIIFSGGRGIGQEDENKRMLREMRKDVLHCGCSMGIGTERRKS
jgi:hypothetical protein